jgi:broad specificity phosphatase PhoE
MKIYILRHEERTIDASFFGPLTKNGILNSINLIPILEKLNINKIYCSPFVRTLQTILPYSKKKNIKINLEYGLVEIQHPDIIAPKGVRVELPDYLEDEFNKNKNYASIIKTSDLQYPEDDKLLERRTKKILKKIIETNYKTNDNILIVTHQGLCKNILKIVNNSFVIDTEYINEYKTGTVSLIFDTNKWVYKKIN